MNTTKIAQIKLMTDNDVYQNLRRAYELMHPYQFAREIYQNAVEAGASRLFIAKEKISSENGVERLLFIDDGCGIPVNDLDRLINRRNSSSKSVGDMSKNFGIGLKDAALIPNSYGLIIASWSEANPRGGCIWLQIKDGVAGARRLVSKRMIDLEQVDEYEPIFVADFGDLYMTMHEEEELSSMDKGYEPYPISFEVDGIDLFRLYENFGRRWPSKTGTMILFMGSSIEQNTYDQLPRLCQFLCSRYEDFSIDVRTGRPDLSRYDTINPFVGDGTSICSYSLFGINVHFYLDDEKKRGGTHNLKGIHLDCFNAPISLNGELFNTLHPNDEGARSKGYREAASWGIPWKKTAKRVSIIVEVPPYKGGSIPGAYMNSERSQVFWYDPSNGIKGQLLDLSKIKEYVRHNLPKQIIELMREEAQETLADQGPTDRLWKRFHKWFSGKVKPAQKHEDVLSFNQEGELTGDLFPREEGEAGSKSEAAGEKAEGESDIPLNAGERKPASPKRRAAQKLPCIVQFIDQDERFMSTCGQYVYPAAYQAGVLGQSGVLFCNRDHNVFHRGVEVCKDWLDHQSKQYNAGDIMSQLVEPMWADIGPCLIGDLVASTGHMADPERLNPERLASHFYGIYQYQHEIARLYKKYAATLAAQVEE